MDAIIDEMICNAWYSVCEFHIHLSGIKADGTVCDGLERAILKLAELSHLHSSASKVEILNTIAKYNSEIKIYALFKKNIARILENEFNTVFMAMLTQ